MSKLSYTHGTSLEPLMGITIGDLFDQIVAQYPKNDALIVPHQAIRWSYSNLKEEVDKCAKGMIAMGLQKGERVGIWSPNRYEWVVAQLATAKIGAILVNINPSYRLNELEYALRQSACSILIIADQFKYSNYTEMIYSLVPELKLSKVETINSNKLPDLKSVIRLHPEAIDGMYTWEQLMAGAESINDEQLQIKQADLHFDEPINIQYTSGTTGFPKGATLSHHNIINNGYFVARTMNYTQADRVIIPVPLYHCFGMVIGNLGCISHGATMVFPSEGFDPGLVLESVQKEKATVLHGVPTMFIAELEHPDFDRYDLSSLRTGVMAGAPCPIEVMKKVQTVMHMKDVQVAYGMTETSPVSTQTRIGSPLEKQVSTVGQIHPHQEIKIIDPSTDKVMPIGETGELCTRGYSVMLGYWNNEEQTNDTIDAARWIHTGDLATMDEEGYIKIVGRIKDMIIRGGENVYPREIEEFLFTHPKISDVQVIGVPDSKYGEEIMAWIKLKENTVATTDEIKTFCKGNIAHFKIPRYYKFTDSFPMTVTGKIRKIEMREISIQELELNDQVKQT